MIMERLTTQRRSAVSPAIIAPGQDTEVRDNFWEEIVKQRDPILRRPGGFPMAVKTVHCNQAKYT